MGKRAEVSSVTLEVFTGDEVSGVRLIGVSGLVN
jgi:hypothetical protein